MLFYCNIFTLFFPIFLAYLAPCFVVYLYLYTFDLDLNYYFISLDLLRYKNNLLAISYGYHALRGSVLCTL